LVALIVLIVVVVVVVGVFIVLYNRLVRERNRIDNAWSQIDVQLRRRYDLIPNLVETVKGYAAHERETLEAVISARQQGIDASSVAEQAGAENMITSALGRLFALSEAYPELKANESFLALQEEITTTEDRIAFARQFYNDRVLKYNTRIQSVPSVLIARPLNFAERDYFEIEGEARGPVEVEF